MKSLNLLLFCYHLINFDLAVTGAMALLDRILGLRNLYSLSISITTEFFLGGRTREIYFLWHGPLIFQQSQSISIHFAVFSLQKKIFHKEEIELMTVILLGILYNNFSCS